MVGAMATTLASPLAQADLISTNFDSMSLGALPGGPDGRAAGNGQWWVPDNAASYGNIVAGQGLGGTQALEVGNRGNGNDGVIDNVHSARLNDMAGESTTGAPNNYFQSSYWFRTASNSATTGFAFKSETWGPDRTTWVGFFEEAGQLNAYADDIAPDGSDFREFGLASGLSWGSWYKVVTTCQFVDGSGNDIVTHSLYDSSLSLVGSISGMTSWEEGARQYGYNGGQIFGVDAIQFQARYSPTGATAYVDDLSYSTSAVPEPGTMAALGIGVAGWLRRRRGR